MGDIVTKGTKDRRRFYMRWSEGMRPAVNPDGSPKLWEDGPKKGQPKVDSDGKPLNERIRHMKVAKGARTKAEAERMLSAIELRLAQGEVGIVEKTPEQHARGAITVKQLGDRFVSEYTSPKVKDIVEYRRSAKSKLDVRINPKLGSKAVASLELADIDRLRDHLLRPEKEGGAELAPASVTLTIAVLSKMFNWGRKQKLLDCPNPVQGCERPTATHSIDYLSKQHVAALLQHAETDAPTTYPMIAVGVFAGLRLGELRGLRWIDVHLDAGRLDVNRSYATLPKSGKARHLPIHPELVRILRAWEKACPKSADGLVFPSEGKQGVWGMATPYSARDVLPDLFTAIKCRVPEKPWHSLRHTFASHFIMAGGNILTLQKLLGHSTLAMTMRYAHLAPDFMTTEVARMSFAVQTAGVADMGEERRKRALGDSRGIPDATAPDAAG